MTKRGKAGVISAFLLAALSAANASVIANPSVTLAGGIYTYDYAVQNSGVTPLISFLVSVPAVVNNIQSPGGWDVSAITLFNTTLVQWVSLDVPFDVPALGSLSGFSIDSVSPPGVVNFTTLDETFTQFEGQTTGPAAPEPGTLWLLLPIMAAGGARVRFRGTHRFRGRS